VSYHVILFFISHPGNLGVRILDKEKDPNGVQLVFYDFGQAATLTPNQADGILDIIEAIVDSDVDQSLEAFAKMGVLKEDANLDIVRAKVADNFKTGKVKANRKRLSKQGYKFKNQVPSPDAMDAIVTSNSTASASSNSTVKDSDVMNSFTLPAEYAFVGRALVQMDGVGKGLDPEFDFISAAAPSIYEIKGAEKYLKEEAVKWFDSFMPHYVSKEEQLRRRSARIQNNREWRRKKRSEWY
jgi:predicted unusual protein kinase regulating ubiquinone biosynthesis (AarF/ABC1/UbiB family)